MPTVAKASEWSGRLWAPRRVARKWLMVFVISAAMGYGAVPLVPGFGEGGVWGGEDVNGEEVSKFVQRASFEDA